MQTTQVITIFFALKIIPKTIFVILGVVLQMLIWSDKSYH